jgi:hypothetical protein
MKPLFLNITILLVPILGWSESMCRAKDIYIFNCHKAWLFYGFIDSLPSIIILLLLSWIFKKLKIFKLKMSLFIITSIPILTLIFSGYLFTVIYSGLTIYGPDDLGDWNYFRDFLLKPLIPTVIVYIILFVLLKISENKKLRKENEPN